MLRHNISFPPLQVGFVLER